MKYDNDDDAPFDEFEHDPLDEPAMRPRDHRGRFRKGSSGNPAGRAVDYRIPRDPALPVSRRRIIHKVADEEHEAKVNGRTERMTLFEANVRALGVAGTRDRVAAMRFIDLVTETSERHAIQGRQGAELMRLLETLVDENQRLKKEYEPQSGVMTVPVDDINNWPPEGLIVDGKVNRDKVRELREERRLRDQEAAKEGGGNSADAG